MLKCNFQEYVQHVLLIKLTFVILEKYYPYINSLETKIEKKFTSLNSFKNIFIYNIF